MRREAPSGPATPMRAASLILFFGLLASAPLYAQPADETEEDEEASETIAAANRTLDLGRKPGGCQGPSVAGEITVCGRRSPDPHQKPVAPPPARDPNSLAYAPPAPGKGAGVGVTMRACILQKCPKPIYYIDLKAIPEAPPGSEADRIAKGEMRAR